MLFHGLLLCITTFWGRTSFSEPYPLEYFPYVHYDSDCVLSPLRENASELYLLNRNGPYMGFVIPNLVVDTANLDRLSLSADRKFSL